VSINPIVGTTLTGRRRNRSWSEALKQEIVAASFAAGASVSSVARRYDVNANQVFAWRKLYRGCGRSAAEPTGPMLVPVAITAASQSDGAGSFDGADRIEIELDVGYRVRVGSSFDAEALGRVLDVLERR
jgi:transposase